MATLDFIMTSFVITANGYGQAGSGEKCSTPQFKKVTEKFRGGGMLATREIALGYEAFRFKCDLTSYDPQVIMLCGLSQTGINWTVNGTLDGDANAKVTSTLQLLGEMVDYNPGDWEAGKKTLTKVEIALTALTLTIGATTVYDIDLIAGKMKIAGVDEMAAVNQAIASGGTGYAALAGL